MKTLKAILSIIITLLFVASCSKSNSVEESGETYTVSGSISQDSASVDADLRLLIDKHNRLVEETLPVLKGKFAYKGNTLGTDELYIIDSQGRTVRFFASAGSHIDLNIAADGRATFGNTDSINYIYTHLVDEFEACREDERSGFLDSVCLKYKNSIASALLIRDRMQLLNDSVLLRQCLGRIDDSAKPAWLVNALELQFDNFGVNNRKNVRLYPLSMFRTDVDSVYINFNETRQNSMYVYFWADYSQESIDSLSMLVPMAKYYGLHEYLDEYVKRESSRRPKRIDILTVCMHAADSASWRNTIKGLPGYHVLLQSGFSNPTMKSWKVTTVPYNMIIDRFSNIQDSYQWGQDLRDALEKTPSNFSVSLNGSKNSISRTARH